MSLKALSDRSFKARLGFAYLIDSLYSFDPTVRPSSTFKRIATNIGAAIDESSSKHSYSVMWDRIDSAYNDYWFNGVLASELSESEFIKSVNAALIKGAEYEKLSASGPEVLSKAAAWGERGWFRYEEDRAAKVEKARRFGMVGGLILTSFIL